MRGQRIYLTTQLYACLIIILENADSQNYKAQSHAAVTEVFVFKRTNLRGIIDKRHYN